MTHPTHASSFLCSRPAALRRLLSHTLRSPSCSLQLSSFPRLRPHLQPRPPRTYPRLKPRNCPRLCNRQSHNLPRPRLLYSNLPHPRLLCENLPPTCLHLLRRCLPCNAARSKKPKNAQSSVGADG